MTDPVKKFALVTDKRFWVEGYGSTARIRALVDYLQSHTRLSVYVIDMLDNAAAMSFASRYPKAQLTGLPAGSALTRANCQAVLGQWLRESGFEAVIVEHLWNHWVADIIPPGVVKILDTHDIIALQIESFRRYGRAHPLHQLSLDQEFGLYRKFDKIMFIQEGEYQEGCRRLGPDKCLLCPHPETVRPPHAVQPSAARVGLLSSPWQPNVDGLIWLSTKVVPLVRTAARFEVYGTICSVNAIQSLCPNLVFKGTVQKLEIFYDTVDIVVNPCKYGSGLKIKCIEALAFGLPLVTTSIGAQGLEKGAGKAFLVADTESEFAGHIERLMGSEQLRRELGGQAQAFIAADFTPDRCFGNLADGYMPA